ncbi:MAG TPA: hypothetical protein ENJ95_17330 [Bacteroidetes bacterium]|nr:hypothetical protein [Bacteroidota bacterium]
MNVVILTPIQIEYDAVRKHLTGLTEKTVAGSCYETGQFAGRHHTFNITLHQTGPKNSSIALATEKAIQLFNPKIILVTGIAGGVKDVDIGDVVVGTKAYGYEAGKETGNGFVARPEVVNYSKELLAAARSTARKNDWKKRCNINSSRAKVVFGPIASGDKVIATTGASIFPLIKKYYNDTTALEMEAIGFGQAMLYHPQVLFANIRGVSDMLENKSKTDAGGAQELAAGNAAGFVFEMMYEMDSTNLNIPIMNSKELSKAIYEILFPISKLESVKDIGKELTEATDTSVRELWEKVRPLFIEEFEELKNDPKDEDNQIAVKAKLKRVLKNNGDLEKELAELVGKVNSEKGGASVVIENSKNVISGSTISVGGNFHLGDKTEIDKKYEIKEIEGNVYIAETINIEQATNTPGAPLAGPEMNAIKMQVVRNKIKPALKTLLEHSAHDPDFNNQVILLASRWNQLQREKNRNTISKSHANIEYNRIRAALLDMIDGMDDNGF